MNQRSLFAFSLSLINCSVGRSVNNDIRLILFYSFIYLLPVSNI
ncbi:Uncharacterised protein [Serratia plymuthica]|nr:Uncharacterised protein [Serratia plymuthica]